MNRSKQRYRKSLRFDQRLTKQLADAIRTCRFNYAWSESTATELDQAQRKVDEYIAELTLELERP